MHKDTMGVLINIPIKLTQSLNVTLENMLTANCYKYRSEPAVTQNCVASVTNKYRFHKAQTYN